MSDNNTVGRAFGAGSLSRSRPAPATHHSTFRRDRANAHDERVLEGSLVRVFENNVQQALKRLDRILKKNGHGADLDRIKCYVKPSVRRRSAKAAGLKNWRRTEAQMAADGKIAPHAGLKGAGGKKRKSRRNRK